MKAHPTDDLPEYVLGTLVAQRANAVAAHLPKCTACRSRLSKLERAMGAVADRVAPAKAPARVMEQLVAEVKGPGRFAHFVDQLADFFDVPAEQARALLASVLDASAWQPGPAEGVDLLPVDAGPKLQGAMAAFVRIPPGRVFPRHEHLGEEVNLVIQGGFRENGKEVWRGDLVREASGTSHAQLGLPGVDCIAASVLKGEIRVLPPAAPKRGRASRRKR